jgi:hypothetical protein
MLFVDDSFSAQNRLLRQFKPTKVTIKNETAAFFLENLTKK